MPNTPKPKQPKPSAAHKRLKVFIGDWHAEGTSYGDGQDAADPRAAGVPWRSDESYEWLPGNFFVLHRWDAMAGKHAFKGAEIIGYDEAEGGYFTRMFDNAGHHPEYRASVDGDVWSFTEAQTRATVTVQEGGGKMTFNWEWKNGSRKWLPLCDRVAVRTRRVADASGVRYVAEETMTTLENRPNTALLVVDMQVGVIAEAHGRDAVVKNVETLVAKARRAHVCVIWVQHSDNQLAKGSDGWRIVPELTPNDAEPVVEKIYGDSFEDTDLEAVLSGLGVGRLVVVGAQSDACIRSTIHGAFVRGYDVTLVSDAHTTEDHSEWGAPPADKVIAHTNLYWAYQTAPGRKAETVETKDVNLGSTS